MKKNIHPEYKEIKVTCSCGNSFTTRSTLTKGTLHIDICSACHPFYTGQQKIVDTAGRVERFKQKYSKEVKAPKASETPKVSETAKAPEAPKTSAAPKTPKTKKVVKKEGK